MKNYLITGVSSYLGREFANKIIKQKGIRVIITSRRECDFDIMNEDNQIKYLPNIDLMDLSEIDSLVQISKDFFDGPFAVINCTGYFKGQKPLNRRDLNEGKKILDGNFTTVYNLSLKLLDLMIELGGGHFIGFSCNSVIYNYPQMAMFSAAKSALESFFRTMANEFYNRNIYANTFQLATLFTDYEIKNKPYGDHEQWLKPSEVVLYILEFLNSKNQFLNGNSIKLYHHSDSFFNKSYFDRIKR